MKLSAISEELRKLAQSEGGTAVLGGTTYRILGNNPDLKFRVRAPDKLKPYPTMTPHQQALHLWKTEHCAVIALERQINTLGDDLCPEIRKRAEKLLAKIANGHVVHTRTQSSHVWENREWVRKETTTEYVTGDSARLLSRYLGREMTGKLWEPELVLTPEDIAKLSETFIIHTV